MMISGNGPHTRIGREGDRYTRDAPLFSAGQRPAPTGFASRARSKAERPLKQDMTRASATSALRDQLGRKWWAMQDSNLRPDD